MDGKIKVLNLYAGIGGNRKLWEGVDVTAVEYSQDIADVYSSFFPDDKMVVADAHQYLLDHYKEFDFIWSSPPCPTHSRIRACGVKRGIYPAKYPDMSLWQEITVLKHFCKSKWVVENVTPYYIPITIPTFKLDRHFFWANFYTPKIPYSNRDVVHCEISNTTRSIYGFSFDNSRVEDKRQVLRNLVNPEVGNHIFKTAMAIRDNRQEGKQMSLLGTWEKENG